MNNIIISNPQHPKYEAFKKLEGFIDYSDFSEQKADIIFDFTALPTSDKKILFEKIDGPFFSDLSLNNGKSLIKEYINLHGAIATVFPSPNLKFEVYLERYQYKNELYETLKKIGLSPTEVSSAGIGFIFGRTITQIINEAWFALEDELATEDAIDTAMLYGVNYPRGPLSWGAEAGLKNVVGLLDELHKVTNQNRYIVCDKLRKACL